MKNLFVIWLFAFSTSVTGANAQVFPGANEDTPARAQYFSWINNTNEGATEAQTLVNLDFFKWLNDEYGMQLDIYAFDAGAIDGKRYYGSMDSSKFKAQFPNGFGPIYERTSSMGIRLGLWGGPDGFGNTPQDASARANMMVKLCEEYEFALFKFDTVAGDLRDNQQENFARMMTRCRAAVPDLIFLNHRINLGPVALPHATTFLWEGQETYTDVHIFNQMPAPHHRAGALARSLPPGLTRLTEDHGVCLGSALDYWDDELILQAFNRSLILSPQIYCNPWLLSDAEFPKLARIFNLARQYRETLVSGTRLPRRRYGPSAISRGDATTRLITLRNLGWEPKTYRLKINETLGLSESDQSFEVRRYHPTEEIIGTYNYGDRVDLVVEPFRSALFRVTQKADFGLSGIRYDIIRDIKERDIEIDVYGEPGLAKTVKFTNSPALSSVLIDGVPLPVKDNTITLQFEPMSGPTSEPHRLGTLTRSELPEDAEALYETTVFSADNNALEVRSLARSGGTRHAPVAAARDAFFDQPLFTERGIWDRNLFDGDLDTAFYVSNRWPYWWNTDPDTSVNDGAFRLDLGSITHVDKFVLTTRDQFTLAPVKQGEGIIAEVSTDLQNWTKVTFIADTEMEIDLPGIEFPVRYLRILDDAPRWLSEVTGLYDGRTLDRQNWRASNLFGAFHRMNFTKSWSLQTKLENISDRTYLSIAIPGYVGNEGVYAAMKVNGDLIGAPDRAPSYPANTWELQVRPVEGNYTYYIPLKPEWSNQELEIIVLGTDYSRSVNPFVWLNAPPVPTTSQRIIIPRDQLEPIEQD